jgi:dephospho-CoA kinase
LNQIVHPRVIRELILRVLKAWILRHEVVVLDIPLFFEGNLPTKYFHDIVVVAVDRDVQVERIMNRNHIPREDAERRVAAQMPIERKCKMGTVVLRNDGTQQELEKILDGLVMKWRTGCRFTSLPDPLFVLAIVMMGIVLILIARHR